MKQLHFLLLSLFLFLTSCSGGQRAEDKVAGDTLSLSYAENLTLIQYDNYTKAILRNPWDTTSVLQTYILIPKETDVLPDSLPQGVILRTPVQNALVYSSVHCSLLCELQADGQIGGVCDAEYIYSEMLKNRLASHTLADCGNSMSPNFEKIIELHPEGIFLSPYENSNGYGKLDKLNIPLVLCADYMETSPLGRAEWMKFYGMLFGKEELAFQNFKEIENHYLSLKSLTQSLQKRPKVLSDTRYGQVWYVPGKYSTMGRLYEDAGAENPFQYLKQSGSAPLSAEQVLEKAHDADIWIMKYNQAEEKTLKQLIAEDAIYKQFKAFKEKQVYGSNTSTSHFYEETPYHPDRLLQDLIQIFHPELNTEHAEQRYFKQLKEE